MLSIAPVSAGHQKYFMSLANSDYYLSGGEPEGQWFSQGADILELRDTVFQIEFEKIAAGFDLKKRPLVQNAGHPDRRPGWDLCFSAPKSVSVLFAFASDEWRQIIRDCQEKAVKYALCDIENNYCFSRRGRAGCRHVPAKMAVAMFEHCTSRALDPDLHTHSIVFNVGVRDDGSTGALTNTRFFYQKKHEGGVYRNELRRLLEQELPIKCKTVESWFEIEGFPKELCNLFSKRRQEIVAKLGELGLESATAAAYATLETRKAKSLVPPRSELFEKWREEANAIGINVGQIIKKLNEREWVQKENNKSPQIDNSIDHDNQDHPGYTRYEFVAEIIRLLREEGFNDFDIDVAKHIEASARRRRGQEYEFNDRVNRRLQVDEAYRRKLLKRVDAIQSRLASFDWSILNVEQSIHKYSRPRAILRTHIDYELRQFKRAIQKKKPVIISRGRFSRQAKEVLGRDEANTVRAIIKNRGPLQVINTKDLERINLCLRVCNETWQKSDVDVWGFSLSRAGANRLQQESGIRSRSFKALELMRKPTASFRAKYAAKELTRQALFGYGYKLKSFTTKKKLLVVNDAHRLTPQQMQTLLDSMNRTGSRLILVGQADFKRDQKTAFDQVAYRVKRNDNLQIRKDYLAFNSNQNQSHNYERGMS